MRTRFKILLCGLGIGFLPLAAALPVGAQTLFGAVHVVDGDTLRLDGQAVRLHGIDAPERDQSCRTEQGVSWPCGAHVQNVVAAWLEGAQVSCDTRGRDRYGRWVAVCRSDGQDIAARLVAEGLARAAPRYSDDYVTAEAGARDADAGLWAGVWSDPARHRVTRIAGRLPLDPSCAIKGNISANGHIYHLPGSPYYDRTGIDSADGERWFCSEGEAIAAGWRAPGA